jgi:hypothetical protein
VSARAGVLDVAPSADHATKMKCCGRVDRPLVGADLNRVGRVRVITWQIGARAAPMDKSNVASPPRLPWSDRGQEDDHVANLD